MGIDDFLLTSTLNLVIGQRLVRRLCTCCREAFKPSQEILDTLYPNAAESRCDLLYRPIGCPQCSGTGYAGRTGLLELLELSEPVRRAILARADAVTIEKAATDLGMRTMLQHGLELRAAGRHDSGRDFTGDAGERLMKRFSYKAINRAGELRSGVLQARSQSAAIAELSTRQLIRSRSPMQIGSFPRG